MSGGTYDERAALWRRVERLEAERAELIAALKECHEAMAYMSEYDIPIGMPGRVRAALEKAGVRIDE